LPGGEDCQEPACAAEGLKNRPSLAQEAKTNLKRRGSRVWGAPATCFMHVLGGLGRLVLQLKSIQVVAGLSNCPPDALSSASIIAADVSETTNHALLLLPGTGCSLSSLAIPSFTALIPLATTSYLLAHSFNGSPPTSYKSSSRQIQSSLCFILCLKSCRWLLRIGLDASWQRAQVAFCTSGVLPILPLFFRFVVRVIIHLYDPL
jgi:hypothetical protein